jgi:uroporphyrinogen-III synthase
VRPDVITFTSSSTVKNFVSLLGTARGGSNRSRRAGYLEAVMLASIGPVTSATLRELRLGVDVEARQYTIPGLIQAIIAGTRPM